MLDGKFQRGFSNEKLTRVREPKVRKDEKGFFIMTLSENSKVYFDEYYGFLDRAYEKAMSDRDITRGKLQETADSDAELVAYFRARLVVIDLLLRNVVRFYTDGTHLGIVMTPWCFGTVMLEKVEVYRDRISKGEVDDPNVADYPYYVVKYIDEIYKAVLLDLFDFPEKAFAMRWQYSELLKRYSGILTEITNSLQSVIQSVKKIGS